MDKVPINVDPRIILERGIVEKCKYTEIQPNGIDLSTREDIILEHTEFKQFKINETIRIPDDMFGLIWSRSTFNRQGIIIRGTVFDSGYVGRPSFSVYNFSGDRIYIKKNTRVCQILFFYSASAFPYHGKYQNGGL